MKILIQIISLIIFLLFFLFGNRNYFIDLSFYSGLITMISSRKIIFVFFPSIFLLISGIFLKRKFCWYVCPFGSLQEFFNRVFKVKRIKFKSNMKYAYFLLYFFLLLSFFGISFGNNFAPLVILNRFLTSIKSGLKIYFLGGFLFAFFILILSVFVNRFWCHNFCPLGAALDLTGKLNRKKKNNFSLKRRDLIKGVISGGVLLIPFKFVFAKAKKKILRPPGAGLDFLNKCLRCFDCINKCPTKVIKPLFFENGVLEVFTPYMDYFSSYCEYECKKCIDVCPSKALGSYTLGEKKRYKIGIAKIDRSICLPWAYDTPCIVCEEVCPVPEKAIKLRTVKRKDSSGLIQVPVVYKDLCIGCGICQNKCPVPERAIRVYSYEEV